LVERATNVGLVVAMIKVKEPGLPPHNPVKARTLK